MRLEKQGGRGNFGVIYLGRIRWMKMAVKKINKSPIQEAFLEVGSMMRRPSH
ncbi:hypothetical protein TSMEX_009268 [Taenia solium]|eukprot:TsM_000347400 transcript=TsM_000347400 gene=TsM_000347400